MTLPSPFSGRTRPAVSGPCLRSWGLVWLMTIVAAIAGRAQSVVTITGNIETVALPSNLGGGQFISQTHIRMMDEGTGTVTAATPGFQADGAYHNPSLGVGYPADSTFQNAIVTAYAGPGLPAAGTEVHSYLLHFDPDVSGLSFSLTEGIAQSGTITFDRPIIGVYVTSGALNATDAVFTPTGTVFSTSSARDMEFNYDGDAFSVSADRLTLNITMFSHNGGVFDQARIILGVDEPEPIPPTVSITAPADGVVFGAPASFTVTADADGVDDAITQVEFFQDAVSLGVDSSAPYSRDVSNLGVGTYVFTALATDTQTLTMASIGVTVMVVADTDGDEIPDAWESAHGLDPDDPDDGALDLDGDGVTNHDEFVLGTDLRDPTSRGIILSIGPSGDGGYTLIFVTMLDRTYTILRTADWMTWTPIESDLPGTGSPVELTDHPGAGSGFFYRIEAHVVTP